MTTLDHQILRSILIAVSALLRVVSFWWMMNMNTMFQYLQLCDASDTSHAKSAEFCMVVDHNMRQ